MDVARNVVGGDPAGDEPDFQSDLIDSGSAAFTDGAKIRQPKKRPKKSKKRTKRSGWARTNKKSMTSMN
jgi:hypothetical protein